MDTGKTMNAGKWLRMGALALVAATLLAAFLPVAAAEDPGAWPMYRGTSEHRGYSALGLSESMALLWSEKVGSGELTSPVASGGKLFVGSSDGHLYALSEANGNVSWKFNSQDGIDSEPALYENMLYVITDNGRLIALSADKGEKAWEAQLPSGTGRTSHLAIAGGAIYVTSEDGLVMRLSTEQKGASVWNVTVGGHIRSPPTVGDNIVFVVTEGGKVAALDAGNGTQLWTTSTTLSIPDGQAPVYADGRLYLGTKGRVAMCLDARTRGQLWSTKLKAAASGSPALGGGCIALTTEGGQLYVLSANDGRDVWNVTPGAKLTTSPVIAGSSVLVGSGDGRVLMYELSNPTLRWSGSTGGNVTGSPALSGGSAIFATKDGRVLMFGKTASAVPVAVLKVEPATISAGGTVSLSAAESYDPSGKLISQSMFDFGDGNSTGWTSSAAATHSYSSPGTYSVSARVRSSSGELSALALQAVVVKPVPKPAAPTPVVSAPVATAAVSFSALAVLGAFGATEFGKYKLLTFLFVPLYVRLKRDEVLDNYIRGKIHGYIIANPGDHYNSIRDALELSNGILAHHLHTLEREGLVQSMRDGMYRRFWPANAKLPPEDEGHFNIQKRIVAVVRNSPGISQKEIAEKVGVSGPTVNYHISVLASARMIRVEKVGRKTQCFVIEAPPPT